VTASRDRRLAQVGIDRVVRLKWLEKTASLCLAGNDAESIAEILKADLREHFRFDESVLRGSIGKSITVLLNVWLRAPAYLQPLRGQGIEMLRRLPRGNHIAIHWGMITAVYPFWASVAAQVGRLLRLQSSVAAAHVQRRVREQYGERETVSRRVRYVLRSYVDWGVLNETESHGVYGAGLPLPVDDPALIAWLVEASLHARPAATAPLKDLIDGPSLFPFRIKPIRAESLSASCPRIELLRHGLDDELVMLRQQQGKFD
jgi:hypothetical protein